MHNRALKAEIERLRYADELLALEVDSLAEQQRQMQGPDAIKDAAFKYGYLEEGEQVFYFDLPPDDVRQSSPRYAPRRPSFEGVARWKLALIAIAIASAVSVLAAFMCRRRR
ncbi:MAG: hypothetical protein M0Q37_03235 [Sphaerochaeta sp.]|nr:hypothetical protein [Sphaerochaeta sp.]